MKYTYSEYRRKAWNSLETTIWSAVCLTLISYVLAAVLGSSVFISFLVLALLPLQLQFNYSFLQLARTGELPKPAYLFEPYKSLDDFLRLFLVELLKNIFIVLWTLLLIIPGIIMNYAYAMTEFIAKDEPELTPIEVIRKSKEIMRGHKWDLFVLDLTFIGWILLGCLTCGLLFMFVTPYMNTAHAHFYQSLKEENNELGYVKASAEEA